MPEQAKWLEIAAVTAMQLLLRLFSPRPSGTMHGPTGSHHIWLTCQVARCLALPYCP